MFSTVILIEPHTRDGMQYYLITPEIPLEQQATVLLVVTMGDSNPYWDPPTPQCHTVTSRPGTYYCKSAASGLQ